MLSFILGGGTIGTIILGIILLIVLVVAGKRFIFNKFYYSRSEKYSRCPHCGKYYDEEQYYCPHCGEVVGKREYANDRYRDD